MEKGHTQSQFPETRWTLVQQAGDDPSTRQALALEELCRLYWPPVYAFIRSRGKSPPEAEDLTQGFFSDILRRSDLGAASEEKGRLRTFLLVSVRNFIAKDWQHHRRLKRGGGAQVIPLPEDAEDRYSAELADHLTPEQVFDRHWAVALLDSALAILEAQHRDENKSELFYLLRPHLSPAGGGMPQREIAEQLGIRENTVNVSLHRLKKQYRDVIRREIADTLGPGQDVNLELQALFGAFA